MSTIDSETEKELIRGIKVQLYEPLPVQLVTYLRNSHNSKSQSI